MIQHNIETIKKDYQIIEKSFNLPNANKFIFKPLEEYLRSLEKGKIFLTFDKKTYDPNYAVDAEFISVKNGKTIPLAIGVSNSEVGKIMYLHPKAPVPDEYKKHPTFRTPYVLLDVLVDYYGIEWRFRDATITKPSNSLNFIPTIFFSYKDIEFMFADEVLYRECVLPFLERKRRIRLKTISGKIALPFDVKIDSRWHYLSIEIIDISAMQGAGSLADYARNVGINVDSKDAYTSQDKSRMDLRYIEDHVKFESYLLGVDIGLVDIKNKTMEIFNKIALETLGLKESKDYGLSTGKIVATMFTDYIALQINAAPKDIAVLNRLASPDGIKPLARLLRNQNLLYLGMVDGGRCVKERNINHVEDDLIDIDISGCYGNGLLNQIYPLGQPTLITERIKIKDFLKKYEKQLIPGLWIARVSYIDAPFYQDLLISKVEKDFQWDLGIDVEDINDEIETDEERIYSASMILQTKSINHASLNHDLLQILRSVCSKKEWDWLLENMYVETAAIYCKKHQVEKVTTKMLKGINHKESKESFLSRDLSFVVIDLKEPVHKLLSERKKYAKGTSLNTFLKLVINTIYGVTASSYFSEDKAGISNYVVAGNITARARGLAWIMAKGLNSYMSITDGGVFPINKVLKYKRKSLDLLTRIYDNLQTDSHRKKFVEIVPLMVENINCDDNLTRDKLSEIDIQAFKHLQDQFKGIDILENNQYRFESKGHYKQLTLHSKADYRLIDSAGNVTIKIRGMSKINDPITGEKVINPVADQLFDDIQYGIANKYAVEDKKLLSLKDWTILKDDKERFLPHDTIADTKTFYTLTNLGIRYKDQEEYKKFNRLYIEAKKGESASELASVKDRMLIHQ